MTQKSVPRSPFPHMKSLFLAPEANVLKDEMAIRKKSSYTALITHRRLSSTFEKCKNTVFPMQKKELRRLHGNRVLFILSSFTRIGALR